MRILFFIILLVPFAAAAQGSGELWEITMNIPGMPAGMMKPQRVCQGDDPSRAATQDPSKKDCKVTSSRKTASGSNVTLSCPDGSTITIDQQYNAARTEFKSTMSSKGGRDGDLTMNMTGRKVGACDAVAEKKARDDQAAAMKKQAEAGMAASAAYAKQADAEQIKGCNVGLENMEAMRFGLYMTCYKNADKKAEKGCQQAAKERPEVAKTCNAKAADFCKRYQTPEGFLKTKADEIAAKMCGVTTASVKAAQCPKAAQGGSLAFLGAYCPVEAKPIAQEHCVGRDYTSKMGGKYGEFCMNYLANNSLEKPPATATDQVKQGVSKGIDKLKGLFGR